MGKSNCSNEKILAAYSSPALGIAERLEPTAHESRGYLHYSFTLQFQNLLRCESPCVASSYVTYVKNGAFRWRIYFIFCCRKPFGMKGVVAPGDSERRGPLF